MSERTEAHVAARPRTLLLVDDEPNILAALRRLLRRDGYAILASDGPEKALEILRSHEVDVVLSDQRMPGISGVEFLREVRRAHPDTVRIVLSGYTDLQFITDAINEGAIYKFLTKPWDDAQLREQIREAFRSKEIADENRRLTMELRAANAELRAHVVEREHQARRIETVLATLQEIVQMIPWPIIGVDQEGLVALANPAAESVLAGRCAPLLGAEFNAALPEVASVRGDADGVVPAHLVLDGHRYRAIHKSMGLSSASRGALIALIPDEARA